MKKAPIPKSEKRRIKTLTSYKVLDTSSDPQLDEIVEAASRICGTKISLVSLVDSDRQWFKAKYGLDATETPRDVSFCGHAIHGDDLFVIEDAFQDKRFSDNPLVTGAPHVRFYAGAPLKSPNGEKLGTLCVIDSKPRKLSEEKIMLLKVLSKQVINYLEIKKQSNEQQILMSEYEDQSKKHNKVLGSMLEGVIVQDQAGSIVEHNPRALEILGLSEGQLLGRISLDPEWQTVKPDGSPFPEEEHPSMVTLKTGKDCSNVIMGIEDPKVGLKWIRVNSAPMARKDGLYAVTTFQDITDWKQLEKELKSSNKYLDLALEGAGLGSWDWYLKTNDVKFDRRWAEMLGLNIDEIDMELKTWESRVHPDDLKQCYDDIKNYMDGKTDRYENIHRMKHKDGHWVYILDRGRFSDWDTDGNPIRFTGTHLDITETKKAQEERLNEINDILSSTPSCLMIMNKDGELLDMNSQGLQLIEAEDLKSVFQANVYDLVEEGHRDRFIQFNNRICEGSKESLIFEIIGLKGTRKWMETYAAPYRLPGGEIAHIAITNEISDRIQAEKDFAEQKAIAQHNAKLASIGELAAGVGHEINNPLAIVKAYIQVLETIAEQKSSIAKNELDPYFAKMFTAIDRIAKIVDGLRTFSRTSGGELSAFSPVKAVEESYNMIYEIYKKEGVNIVLDIQGELKEQNIKGNPGKFQQILMNLISNARDAVARQENKEITIQLTNQDSQFHLSIQDNGDGLQDKVKSKIFDPFFSTKGVNEGTGIGLSLVHNFVNEMCGTVRAENHSGGGAEFIVEIPFYQPEEKVISNGRAITFDMKFDHTAILVDDEEEIRELLGDMLESLGLKVKAFENGKLALKEYQKNPEKYDLIITDMKMPKMSGPELVQAIRSQDKLKQPKLVFITGGINIDFEDEGNELYQMVDGYFLKPFDKDKILEVLWFCLKKNAESQPA